MSDKVEDSKKEEVEQEENPRIAKYNRLKNSYRSMIIEVPLDDGSAFSYLYLTSVYHHNLEKLKEKLKMRYVELDSKIKNELVTRTKDLKEIEEMEKANKQTELDEKSFEKAYNYLELEEAENEVKEELEEAGYDYGEKNLFAHAMAVIILILVIQLSFVYTILMEYMSTPKVITDDPELIALRVTAFLSMGILLWTILSNGKKIFLAAYYHEYLFKSKQRNTMCLVAGFFQIIVPLFTFFTAGYYFATTDEVADTLISYSGMTVICDVDEWVCDYFIGSKKDFQIYTNDRVSQFLVMRKIEYQEYTWAEILIDIGAIIVGYFAICPLYYSLNFTGGFK